ncbi:hypothetical protein DCC85_00065 [Paenibacillus sp. CAA11]|nr:hypothetical protein DCC85_00065 [Paenibacillus sp. CAA11]
MSAVLILTAGCNSTTELSWKAFDGAAVEQSFPVPKEASTTETAPNNSKVAYVRYSMPGLKETLPEEYEDEIKAWGWTEQKEAKKGSTHVYTKNKQIVQLSLQKDSIVITVPKEANKVVIHGLESNP